MRKVYSYYSVLYRSILDWYYVISLYYHALKMLKKPAIKISFTSRKQGRSCIDIMRESKILDSKILNRIAEQYPIPSFSLRNIESGRRSISNAIFQSQKYWIESQINIQCALLILNLRNIVSNRKSESDYLKRSLLFIYIYNN